MGKSLLKVFLAIALSLFFLAACTTGFHGSFAPNTYMGSEGIGNSKEIGPVMGQSCQTKILYMFPARSPPSTAEAIQAARGKYEGTKYLTDISIDDRTEWGVGYSKQCITAEGIAHR